MNLTDLELEILKFIDGQTWNKNQPKIEMHTKGGRKRVPHRIKIRWNNIQFKGGGEKGKKTRRFTENDHAFEKAIYNLKVNKLITSRTKVQSAAGLTCTALGHEIANN